MDLRTVSEVFRFAIAVAWFTGLIMGPVWSIIFCWGQSWNVRRFLLRSLVGFGTSWVFSFLFSLFVGWMVHLTVYG
jgi:hypothetical protein